MERRWDWRTATGFTHHQQSYVQRRIRAFVERQRLRIDWFLLTSVLLAGFSLYFAIVYDWQYDLAQPIFLLQIPLLAWRYTWSASFLLAILDPTGYFPMEMCAVYFTVMTFIILWEKGGSDAFTRLFGKRNSTV